MGGEAATEAVIRGNTFAEKLNVILDILSKPGIGVLGTAVPVNPNPALVAAATDLKLALETPGVALSEKNKVE